MFKIKTLNNISVHGLNRLPKERYKVGSDIDQPDAYLLRSADLHKQAIPNGIIAIARAGAGTNNIPVSQMSMLGIPVFNAPGANANAVKELVLLALLMAARNIPAALSFAAGLQGSDAEMHKAMEDGKKAFVGFELPSRSLGVIGLGAIGVKLANIAVELGMDVHGFDPAMTVNNAWQLDSRVKQALSVDDLLVKSQFVSLHVPLLDSTRKLINAERLQLLKKDAVVLNFSRAEIVDELAIVAALDANVIHAYACDFPSNALKAHAKVIATPHLGASTAEAEDNCAIMVAEQLRDFLERGNIRNSVNFPDAVMPLLPGKYRLTVVNANVPNMVGQITTTLARHGLNIADLLNKSRGELAYTLVDVDSAISDVALLDIKSIAGVLKVRVISAS